MIAKITHGDRFGGLMVYLAGDGREEEHTDQHLIAGDPALMAMHGGEHLDRDGALAIAHDLDRHRRVTGTRVVSGRRRYDSEVGDYVSTGRGDEHVWQCSLSLGPDEGSLSDEKWSAIAHEFMAGMGFDDASDPREPARWVAVRHGLSSGGNDHIHLVASVIRPDGTKVAGYRDYRRASAVVHELEKRHGLKVVEGRTDRFTANERGYTQPEDFEQRATRRAQGKTGAEVRSPDELVRHDVHRRVRAAAAAAADEAEFVRRLREGGLGVRPRFAKGTDEVVIGYSVRLPAREGQDASRWFAGGKIARDLSLPALRDAGGWSSTPEGAAAAAAEWRAGGRELAPVAPGRETRPVREVDWRRWYQRTDELLAQLGASGDNPHVWAQAAGEAAGALAAWSCRVEGEAGGALGNASRALARSAWIARQPSQRPRGVTDRLHLGDVAVMLAAAPGRKSATLDAALLAQVMRLAQAVHAAHTTAGRTGEAARLAGRVRTDLAAVAKALPAVRTLAEYDQAQPAEAPGAGRRSGGPGSQAGSPRRGAYRPSRPVQVDPERVVAERPTPAPAPVQEPQHKRR